MSDGIKVNGYHAHIYHDEATRPVAERLRQALHDRFGAELGPSSGTAVGPHPVPQVQAIFTVAQFPDVVPWLMLNRAGLDILVHPLTDSNYDDHAKHALWLGMPVALKLDTLHRPYGARQYPKGSPLAAAAAE
jgi:aromatic ring-cleaving dioxygenase